MRVNGTNLCCLELMTAYRLRVALLSIENVIGVVLVSIWIDLGVLLRRHRVVFEWILARHCLEISVSLSRAEQDTCYLT